MCNFRHIDVDVPKIVEYSVNSGPMTMREMSFSKKKKKKKKM